ncbi:MAG TPA: glycosyltransferase [Polyangiaceae bacterium]
MKIAFVTTYPPAPCGIGVYSSQLRRAIQSIEPETSIGVVAEQHAAATSEIEPHVERIWRRGTNWAEAAARAVVALGPDVVHLQHEEALLGQDRRLIQFLERVGQAGIARVVTLHSVYGGSIGPQITWSPRRFHAALGKHAEAIVVHQQLRGRDTLLRHGVGSSRIHVIPHGTTRLDAITRDEARRILGIPLDAKVALFLGVIHLKKNLHTALAGAAQAATRVPGFKLVVAGQPRRRNPFDAAYMKYLRPKLEAAQTSGWLDYRDGFVAAADLARYLIAADVVLFPYDENYGSASGVFHLALGAGRASICSMSPKFEEARELFGRDIAPASAKTRDADAWAAALESMLLNDELRQRAEHLAQRAAIATSWDRVAELHLTAYRQAAILRPGTATSA